MKRFSLNIAPVTAATDNQDESVFPLYPGDEGGITNEQQPLDAPHWFARPQLNWNSCECQQAARLNQVAMRAVKEARERIIGELDEVLLDMASTMTFALEEDFPFTAAEYGGLKAGTHMIVECPRQKKAA